MASRPERRRNDLAGSLLGVIEDSIYVVVALLLVIAAAFLLWSAGSSLVGEVSHGGDPVTFVLTLLDKGLTLFIIAELLHTVRVTVQSHTLDPEPFLIVGLIAGIRRVLILTAESTRGSFQWGNQGIELALLIGLIIVMTVSLVLWRRHYPEEAS